MSEKTSRPIDSMMDTTLEKIKEVIDANTVVGSPITLADGTVMIPVSKVNYGFASGGSDIPSKHEKEHGFFGGGAGAGVNITPLAFVIIHNGEVKVTQLQPFTSSLDRAVEKLPDLLDTMQNLVAKIKADKETKKQQEIDEQAVQAAIDMVNQNNQ